MPRHIALLRAINLGSHNKIAMPELRSLFAGLGHSDVATYVQSGNVVFTSSEPDSAVAARAIEEQIAAVLGLDVTVLLRSARQLDRVVAANPFARDATESRALHVTFLADEPAGAKVHALAGRASGDEQLAVVGREVFLNLPSGYGRTKLTNATIEKQLGTAATTRNWRTVTTLRDMGRD